MACGGSWLFFLLFFFFFFKVISEDGRLPTISATRLRPACSARWRNGWRFSASSAVLLEVDVGEGELEVSSLEGSDFVAVGRCAAAHWHSGSSEGSGGTTEGRSLLRFPVMIFLSFNRRFEGDEDIGFTMKFWVGDNRNLRQAFPATQAPHARMPLQALSRPLGSTGLPGRRHVRRAPSKGVPRWWCLMRRPVGWEGWRERGGSAVASWPARVIAGTSSCARMSASLIDAIPSS